MNEPLIKDIPSIKETLEQIKTISKLKQCLPFLRPILRVLGIDLSAIDDALTNVDDLVEQAEELAQIPDRFNDFFTSRGWIIYENLSLEVARSAVSKAEAGDIDGGEKDLVNYYSVETVRWQLNDMNHIEAFRPRMRLAQKALLDYEEERYHACVPVVLALLDGLVNELHEKRRGFFSEEVDLQAWDSIAAHSKGLNELTRILQKMRQKTSTEQITLPYRNGIMHGMDLGYDNLIVAAKTWAALFAVHDWALKAEKGMLHTPPEKPRKTWRELFLQMRENAADKELLGQWRAREITVGVDTPSTGSPDQFRDGTPEKRLAEYLHFWQSRNYGYMANCLSPKFGPPPNRAAANVRDMFASKALQSYEFVEIMDIAAAVTEIQTELVFTEYDREVNNSIEFHMINLDAEGRASIRGKQNTDWAIINWEIY